MPLILIHQGIFNGGKMLHFDLLRSYRFAWSGCELTLSRGDSPWSLKLLAGMGPATVGGEHGITLRRSRRRFLPNSPTTGPAALCLPPDACIRARSFSAGWGWGELRTRSGALSVRETAASGPNFSWVGGPRPLPLREFTLCRAA